MSLIRSLAMAVALLGFLILALVANVGVWSVSTLIDSTAFASATNSILSQPEVRSLLADRLAGRLTDLVVPRGETVSPAVRKGMHLPSGTTRDVVQGALKHSIDVIMTDPGMITIQQAVLDDLHRAVLDVVSGDGASSSPEAGIVLDLDALVSALDERLDPDKEGFLGRQIPADLGQLTLVPPAQVGILANALRFLDALRWVLPGLCLAAALLVLLLARARLHAIAWLGLCLVLVGALCMLAASGASLIAGRVLGSHADTRAPMESALDALTASLMTQSAVIAGLGLALLVVGITAGMVTERPQARDRFDRYA